MGMEEMGSEKRLCTCCMEVHEVKTVRVMEHGSFKNVPVDYEAVYLYCDKAEELYMDEPQMRCNDTAVKDAYRRKQGLLTAGEICALRNKYDISQSDLCILLGWGGKTIARYESHQVQDKAHDTILKKLEQDPEWFLCLLESAKGSLNLRAYLRYYEIASILYEKSQDAYLRKTIEAMYTRFHGNQVLHGNAELSLDRTVDAIRYFAASPKVVSLYKVKLMKLLWYSDALSYRERRRAITGLVYQALPMGAVPVGHKYIIDLKNVPCEEVDMGETTAYHFSLREAEDYPSLDEVDKMILDTVIDKLGMMSKNDIVAFMHREQAYIRTAPKDMISFQYAQSLRI